MNPLALIVVPFIAFAVYRAIKALRTGVFESLVRYERTSDPIGFWLGVATQVWLGLLLGGVLVVTLGGAGTAWLTWLGATLFAAYVVVVVGLLVYRVGRARRGS